MRDYVEVWLETDVLWLKGLYATERAAFLALLAHRLTISGRAIALLPRSAEDILEKLRQLNEIQHRVAGYMIHALGSDEDVGWLNVVAHFVLEPKDADLREASRWAWSQAREAFQASKGYKRHNS